MSLRKLHTLHLGMKENLDRDPTTTPNARATLKTVVRERWQKAANTAFDLIPKDVMPFATEQAWHVFDDKAPGPLEDFLVSIVTSPPTQGHAIHVKQQRFAACDVGDVSALLIYMIKLDAAWKELGINLLVEPEVDGVKIIFFAT
ncbi:MAG: hypothetical protein NTX72_01000 [Candidatus Uhrbacteria bacterium]|nr:hypothetical protein [Candidatus Uhrbacteria bacterium]